MNRYRFRRYVVFVLILLALAIPLSQSEVSLPGAIANQPATDSPTAKNFQDIPIKGRAPKTGYERSQFGSGWDSRVGCDTRNRILQRDLQQTVVNEECKVVSGTLNDPYTGKTIQFTKGETTSDDVQIDHVVALSNAWQTGAQQLSYDSRVSFANDPLNLLAVDGPTNEQKSDSDAATWLPPNKPFRCQYVTRQVSVKKKYSLWVTPAEAEAISRVLQTC